MSGAGQQRKPLPSRLDMVNLCLASSLEVHTFYCEGSRVFHPKTNCKFELLRFGAGRQPVCRRMLSLTSWRHDRVWGVGVPGKTSASDAINNIAFLTDSGFISIDQF